MMNKHGKDTNQRMAQEETPDELKTYFAVLLNHRWLIVGIAALVSAAGLLYAASIKSTFEANLIIHIEEPSSTAAKNALSEATSMYETKKTVMAEVELLRSRKVVSPVVDKLRLDILAEPKRFPFIHLGKANLASDGLSKPGLFGWGGYAWGAEKIDVPVFNVPKQLLGHEFVITAHGADRYRIEDEFQRAWTGRVGQTLVARTDAGDIELRIESLVAGPGAQFLLSRSSKQSVTADLQDALTVTEIGRQSGIMQVTLRGDNPERVRDILDEIGQEYLRQTASHNTENTEKSLAFLNKELPLLKRRLERSEAAYNQFRHRHGAVSLDEEAKISLQQAALAKAKRFELLQRRNELLTRLGEQHPTVVGLNRQMADINVEVKSLVSEVGKLPLIEQDELRLAREVKVNTDLYAALLSTAQQLRLATVNPVSNVRLVDRPSLPERPIGPSRPLIISAAVMAGLLLGTASAFVRRAMSGGIDNATRIEHSLGAKVVLANIPHSRQQKRLSKRSYEGWNSIPLLAKLAPGDPAIESLRSFRTSLQFAMPNFRNNIVMISGATSHLGKSFIAANAAAVIAAGGKRVLLIDMDVRNGHLHRYFNTEQENGLYEAVTGAIDTERCIRHRVLENLDFVPTGAWTADRNEFLMHGDFDFWLKSISVQYDLVLIDAPPVLAAADAAIIGAHCGAVYLVARAGMTTEEEISESVRCLNQAGISPEGILFNDAKLRHQAFDYQDKYISMKRLAWNP